MSPLVAVALGVLQGLTEFLPVSSSGHVAVGALLFGVPDMSLAMVVVVHAGTLLATLMVVGRDVARLTRDTVRGLAHPHAFLTSDEGHIVVGVIVASIPTAVMGLLLEKRVEALGHEPWAVGVCLIVTAGVLLTTRRSLTADKVVLSYGAYFLIGIAQGIAVLPGISRSGTTIAAAMLLGLKPTEAFRFSFLLSLPAVAGAVVLKLTDPGAMARLGAPALIAGTTALGVGFVALLLLRRVVMRGRFWIFSIYLVPVGLTLIAWDLFW